MTEKTVKAHAQLRFNKYNSKMFTNPVGNFWAGRDVRLPDGIKLIGPRRVEAGLIVGSGDLIGWTPIVITQAMVGKTVAVFTSGETKDKYKKPTPKQNHWREMVLADGGIAGTIWCDEDVDKMMEEWRWRETQSET